MGNEEQRWWEALRVGAAAELFQPAMFRWWLAGGHALEAHLGRAWRPHADIDVGISRRDVAHLWTLLAGWDIHVAADGVLTPWDGRSLDDPSDRGGNNLWCRRTPESPWSLDILVGDGDESYWHYRRDPSIHRSIDPSIRRPWAEAVLNTSGGVPYLAPELQLLFKSKGQRPKDDVDAATVIPLLDPERRSWLADNLVAGHPWQTTIAGHRASLAVRAARAAEAANDSGSDVDAGVAMLAAGRSSQVWRVVGNDQPPVIRVPIPNSGRVISYRSEVLIGDLLAAAGHPVGQWTLETIDDVECSIGSMLRGSAIGYESVWSPSFVAAFAAVLRDLHHLPATGWGPLANDADQLRGTFGSATDGIIARWFHAPIWPFDGTDLEAHPVASLEPDLLPMIAAQRDAIVAAAGAPFGVVHSDLHCEHLLQVDGELSGVLDFGDAFVGSTAWDPALLHWYYGADNARLVAAACGPNHDLFARGATLAVALGCYKLAKSPADEAVRSRLRLLLSS